MDANAELRIALGATSGKKETRSQEEFQIHVPRVGAVSPRRVRGQLCR
jgi:hypothetical protein